MYGCEEQNKVYQKKKWMFYQFDIVYMLFCTILYDISYWIGFLKWRKKKYFAINELQILKLSDSNQKEDFNPFLETSYAYFSFYFVQKCYF